MATSPTSPVPHKSKDFVSLNDNFGYALEIEEVFQAIRQFEIRTTSRYCVFYAKHLGKKVRLSDVLLFAKHYPFSERNPGPGPETQLSTVWNMLVSKSSISLSYLPAFI